MVDDTTQELRTVINHEDIQETLRNSSAGFWRIIFNKKTGAGELYLNDNMARNLGIDKNMSPEERYLHWTSRVAEVEQPFMQKAIADLIENPKLNYEMEYLWEHPKYGVIPVRAMGHSVLVEGEDLAGIEGHLTLLHNVERIESTLRNSNINMEAMYAATPIGIGILNFNMELVDCNPMFLELFGIEKKEDMPKGFFSFSPEYQECGTKSSTKAKEVIQIAYEKAKYTFEWLHCNASGEVIPFEITLLRTYSGGRDVFMSFFRDLRSEKKFIKRLADRQEELQVALIKAEEARKSKNLFFANISHEIRTPMNAIMGMSHLCRQYTQDEKILHYLGNIYKAGESLLHIVNDVLDISKIEAGKLEFETSQFCLSDILDNIASTASTLASGKPVDVLFNIDPSLATHFIGDSTRLGQVITNLVSNAIKFTTRGYVLVKIYQKSLLSTVCTLGIEVTDTGAGMDKDRLEAIFRPFEQAELTTTGHYGGTGLGLTISKNIVEKMGGSISVKSTLGVGTTFSCFVNLAIHEENTWLDFSVSRKENILILDDMTMSGTVLEEMLKKSGFRVDTATDHKEAFALLKYADSAKNPYSVVIIDQQIYKLSASEVATQIQELHLKKQPRLILSSDDGLQVKSVATEKLFDSFIPKPVQPMQLWTSIMQALKVPLVTNSDKNQKIDDLENYKELQGKSVLLTEDNEINQEIAIALLEELGIFVTVANNGKEAVELCKKRHFDALLMDIQMPVMDGLTATKYICMLDGYSDKKIPIIAMTAHAMRMHRAQSLEAGMCDHLTKPIDPKTLREVLYTWMVRVKQ